jgi:hypothetical protein
MCSVHLLGMSAHRYDSLFFISRASSGTHITHSTRPHTLTNHTFCCTAQHSRLLALDVFVKLIPYVDDQCRLQRLVPYVVSLLSDQHSLIKVTALRTLTKIVRSHLLVRVRDLPRRFAG